MSVAQTQMLPGPGPVAKHEFWYEGSDTLYPGYLVCLNADYGTTTAVDGTRTSRVEKPATGNLKDFAGVVAEGRPSYKGPCRVPLVIPAQFAQMCNIFCDVDSSSAHQIVTLKAGSYIAGKIGEGPIIGRTTQLLDRDTTNGLIQCRLVGLNRANVMDSSTLAGAGPSPIIWQNCPWEEIGQDPTLGYRFFDDFLAPITMADATAQGGYYTKQDTGVTILAQEDGDERGGILEVANNDDDVDFGHFFLSDGVVHNTCWIADGGIWAPFWFEARLKIEVLTSEIGIFIGLGEIGLSDDAGLVINTAEVKDEDFIGFQTLCADTDALLPVYKATGQTKANGTSTAITADTYFKVGMWGDGTTITSYIDGVSKQAITAAIITGATFPNDVAMTLALMTQTGEASESAVKMDWWRYAQLRI